jgi:hypothetical protein
MRLFLKKRTKGRIEFGILYGGIALLVLCAARFLPVLSFVPSCTFKGLTGLPCPTCGSTRSIVHLAHGELLSSLAMNPLTSICIIGSVLFFFYSLFTLTFDKARVGIALTDREKNIVRAGVLLLVFINWSYLIVAL